MDIVSLLRWYTREGRHDLPWRATTDPWAVLVSEVMLQQTPVARVLPYYRAFIGHWPTPKDCAAAPLSDILGLWRGLGYPRRAVALHRTATAVDRDGWPRDSRGLRALPGIGEYTSRALLVLTDLAVPGMAVPRDINVQRVVARSEAGAEPEAVSAREVDRLLREAGSEAHPTRDLTLALFDLGASHCRPHPRCDTCPLVGPCLWGRRSDAPAPPPRRRQAAYRGSLRQLRGLILSASLEHPAGLSAVQMDDLCCGFTRAQRLSAIDGLVADSLIDSTWAQHQRLLVAPVP